MSHYLADLQTEDIVLDALPDDVVASMESRDRWMAGLPYAEGGLEFLVADLQSWTPGQNVRVAFLGGSTDLHRAIEAATGQISDAAGLTLDFKQEGSYRTWTADDADYAAEIRVSFDQPGYFSLVGSDSVNPNVGLPQHSVGGAPHQRSLNLSGFDVSRPPTWEGTTRDEFLHALAFHHEHQNMRGPCEASFRWEDDPGYTQTRDSRGAYVPDAGGLRPGIYTYLSGFPNGWSKAKVDHNLRTRTQPSPCSPSGDGQQLSEGDKRALGLLYPQEARAAEEIAARREALLGVLEGSGSESTGGAPSALATHAAERLRAGLHEMHR